MRQLRLLLLVFFAVVAVIFGVSYAKERMTRDDRPPVIQAENNKLEVPLTYTDEDLLVGMTATDNLDGDVTDTIVVVSKSKVIAEGTIRVDYAAFDRNNNVGTFSRRVVFPDYEPPRFRLTQPMRFLKGSSNYNYLQYVTAQDCLDGDITRQVKISTGDRQAINDSITEQPVNLQVTNSFGDTSEVEMMMTMEDYTSYNRQVPALSEYLVYVKTGGTLNPKSLLTGIWAGGKTRPFSDTRFTENHVVIRQDNLDLKTPGVYQVTYELYETYDDYWEEVDNLLSTTTLLVVVEE